MKRTAEVMCSEMVCVSNKKQLYAYSKQTQGLWHTCHIYNLYQRGVCDISGIFSDCMFSAQMQ